MSSAGFTQIAARFKLRHKRDRSSDTGECSRTEVIRGRCRRKCRCDGTVDNRVGDGDDDENDDN
eukprot:374152-Hanusia_phi.AAC.1